MRSKILSLFFLFFLTIPVNASNIETMVANHPQIQQLERNRHLREQLQWLPSMILNLFLPIDDDALLVIYTDFQEMTD